jgi:hypothetical protein
MFSILENVESIETAIESIKEFNPKSIFKWYYHWNLHLNIYL